MRAEYRARSKREGVGGTPRRKKKGSFAFSLKEASAGGDQAEAMWRRKKKGTALALTLNRKKRKKRELLGKRVGLGSPSPEEALNPKKKKEPTENNNNGGREVSLHTTSGKKKTL